MWRGSLRKNSFVSNKYASESLGNIITVKSNDRDGNIIFIMYCHLDKVHVKKGDKVIHGQNIALSGSTGNASDQNEPNGTKNKGIDKRVLARAYRSATTYANVASMGGQSRKEPKLFMKTKFDENGKAL